MRKNPYNIHFKFFLIFFILSNFSSYSKIIENKKDDPSFIKTMSQISGPKSLSHLINKLFRVISREIGISVSDYDKSIKTKDINNPKVQQFSVITMPKGGTHLLTKLLSLIEKELGIQGKGLYKQAHTMGIPQYLLNRRLKIILIRDPRDMIVSSSEWVDWHVKHKITDPWFINNWPRNSFKKKLKLLLFPKKLHHLDAFECNNILKFTCDKNNLVVRFEDLVGEKGGGNRENQKKTIYSILNYLNISLEEQAIEKIMNQLWGNTNTFRKGIIGRGKQYINDKQMKDWMNYRLGHAMLKLGYIEDYNW